MNAAAEPSLRFGAVPGADGRVRFRLYAPAQQQVELLLDDDAPRAMQRAASGWFELELAARAGPRYRYRLADGLVVPDPASRAQAGDVHDASLVVATDGYAWKQHDWRGRPWHETVLYELHPGCCGGFRGIAERLPRLAELGITAIELMPVHDFPGARNWGYDGVLPHAPDRRYGTPDEFKALVDRAHELGVMVFLDVVYNHFGPDGNYLHALAPDFFRNDRQTPWGAAIDFRQRVVREYFIGNALQWISEYRIDGLRFDAVHAISERDFLEELAARIRAVVEPGRHVHLVLENEHNDAALLGGDAYDAQWNDDAHNALHVLLTGERDGYYALYAEQPAQHLARVLAEGFAWQGEALPDGDGRTRGTPSAQLPPTAFVFFLQNHDQIGNRAFGERLIALIDADVLRAAVALQLLCPQIPLLFMGEEWGCRTPFLFFTDHNAELAPKVTAGRRAEFAKFAVFADAAQRERIPDPNADDTYTQSIPDFDEAGRGEHATWLAYYRELLALRHAQLVPRLAGARSRGAQLLGAQGVFAQWTLGDGSVLSIAVQFAADACTLPLLPPGLVLFDSRGAGAGADTLHGPCCRVFLDDHPESA